MTQPARVVFDTDILVGASTHDVGVWRRYPTIPPISPSPYADCIGIVADPLVEDWALWASEKILEFVAADLIGSHHWEHRLAMSFVHRIADVCEASGGGVIAPRTALGPAAPERVRHVWGTAIGVGAVVVVSDSQAVIEHAPWPPNKGGSVPYGTLGLSAREFRREVDRARRGSSS